MNWKDLGNNYKPRLEELEKMTSYEILEVNANVTLIDPKKAYRNKIRIYHPDGADGFMREYTEEVSKLINKAYQDLLKITHE